MDNSLIKFLKEKRKEIKEIIQAEIKEEIKTQHNKDYLQKYTNSKEYIEEIERRWYTRPYIKYVSTDIAMQDKELMIEYNEWVYNRELNNKKEKVLNKFLEDFEKYYEKHKDELIEKINTSINNSKSLIDFYEAMMFYREYILGEKLTHYEINFDNCVYDFSGELVVNGEIDVNINFVDFLDNEYVGTKIPSYCSRYGWHYENYSDILGQYGSSVAMGIQYSIVEQYIKNNLFFDEILEDTYYLDYCIDKFDGETIAWDFLFSPNYFGTFDNSTLKEYIEIGKHYSLLYDKFCEENDEIIDEFEFLKDLLNVNY